MDLPYVVFRAWERPEDLRFVDSRAQGVAFLARTIEVMSGRNGNVGRSWAFTCGRFAAVEVCRGNPALTRLASDNGGGSMDRLFRA